MTTVPAPAVFPSLYTEYILRPTITSKNCMHKEIMVKLSHYRPGQALGVPGG